MTNDALRCFASPFLSHDLSLLFSLSPLCLCECVCMCVRVFAYVRVCLGHACVYVHMNVRIYVHVCVLACCFPQTKMSTYYMPLSYIISFSRLMHGGTGP